MPNLDILNQIKNPGNELNKKTAEKFMRGSSHQMGAEYMLLNKADQKNWTRQEFIEHAKKHGYLKTEKDAQILEHVIKKKKIKEYPQMEERRQRKIEQEKRIDAWINKHITVEPDVNFWKRHGAKKI